MLDCNAQAIFEIHTTSRKLLAFKISFTCEIMLLVASGSGQYELRKLFKKIEATSTAIRMHVQVLVDDGYVELCQHKTNRRCKIIQFTDKGWQLMREYEQQVQTALKTWTFVS